jgi:hypothetical protein
MKFDKKGGFTCKNQGIGMMTFVFKWRQNSYYGFGCCILYCKCEVCMMKEKNFHIIAQLFRCLSLSSYVRRRSFRNCPVGLYSRRNSSCLSFKAPRR